jgi:hypothetical protein
MIFVLYGNIQTYKNLVEYAKTMQMKNLLIEDYSDAKFLVVNYFRVFIMHA